MSIVRLAFEKEVSLSRVVMVKSRDFDEGGSVEIQVHAGRY